MAKKKKVRRFYDYSLLFCVIFLMAFGLVMIYSASSYTAQLTQKGDSTYFLKRQFVIAVGGLLVARWIIAGFRNCRCSAICSPMC